MPLLVVEQIYILPSKGVLTISIGIFVKTHLAEYLSGEGASCSMGGRKVRCCIAIEFSSVFFNAYILLDESAIIRKLLKGQNLDLQE